MRTACSRAGQVYEVSFGKIWSFHQLFSYRGILDTPHLEIFAIVPSTMKIISFSSYPCKTESVRCYQASKVQRPLWSWVIDIRKIFASNFSSSSSERCDVMFNPFPSHLPLRAPLSLIIIIITIIIMMTTIMNRNTSEFLTIFCFAIVTDHHYDHDHYRNDLKWYI